MKARGFTLIELLIVVVIIGLLAAIAIPKLANTKHKAYVAQMKSDLRNLSTAEEAFFYDSAYYTTNLFMLNNFTPSSGVTLAVREATPQGWSADVTHSQAGATKCALYQGAATPLNPATVEGRITCS